MHITDVPMSPMSPISEYVPKTAGIHSAVLAEILQVVPYAAEVYMLDEISKMAVAAS